MDDRQTQDLPDDEESRTRLAFAMGHADWTSLAEQTDSHREGVARHFSAIVFRPDDLPQAEAGPPEDLAALWTGDAENAAEVLKANGFSDPEVALDSMQTVRQASDYSRLDQTGRKRLDLLIPRLIEAAAKEPEPGLTLARTLKVVASIARRSAYLALLYENAPARDRLVHVCGLGETLARQLCSVPGLVDELLDARLTQQVMDLEQLEEELDFRLVRTANESEELQLAAISEFKQAAAFRVGVLDLAGGLPLMRVSDLLTGIAELVISRSLEQVWEELAQEYGSPGFIVDGERRPAGFAIIAYGKLAGLEMGYGSDLDLVFVYDAQGQDQITDGPAALDNSDFFFRVARRVISVLTTRSITGRMYEVDTRLRPSGRSGMLVSSLQALGQIPARVRLDLGAPGPAPKPGHCRRRACARSLRSAAPESSARIRAARGPARSGDRNAQPDAGRSAPRRQGPLRHQACAGRIAGHRIYRAIPGAEQRP